MDDRFEESPTHAFCLFHCDSLPLGVPLEVVAEVLEPVRLVRLPLCPRQVLGLCTYRGKIVPVLRPGAEMTEPSRSTEISEHAYLILKTAHGLWGLGIDRAGVTVEVSRETRHDRPFSIPGGFVSRGGVDHDGTMHAILDHEGTWTGLKSEIDRWYRDALGLDPARSLSGANRIEAVFEGP